MPSQTLRPDADLPEPEIDGGNPAEAAARKRIAQARAWQWWAALRGDLCEHRSAAAALQCACDELSQARTTAARLG
jgi:hypothetical protein